MSLRRWTQDMNLRIYHTYDWEDIFVDKEVMSAVEICAASDLLSHSTEYSMLKIMIDNCDVFHRHEFESMGIRFFNSVYLVNQIDDVLLECVLFSKGKGKYILRQFNKSKMIKEREFDYDAGTLSSCIEKFVEMTTTMRARLEIEAVAFIQWTMMSVMYNEIEYSSDVEEKREEVMRERSK